METPIAAGLERGREDVLVAKALEGLDAPSIDAITQQLDALPADLGRERTEALDDRLLSIIGPLVALLQYPPTAREVGDAAKTAFANAADSLGVLDSLSNLAGKTKPLIQSIERYVARTTNSGFLGKLREIRQGFGLISW